MKISVRITLVIGVLLLFFMPLRKHAGAQPPALPLRLVGADVRAWVHEGRPTDPAPYVWDYLDQALSIRARVP